MDLAAFALEALDVGVVLVVPDTREVTLSNTAARRCLEPFDCEEFGPLVLPEPLWEAIGPILERGSVAPGRLTEAVAVNVPDGCRLFIRARSTDCPKGTVLVTIAVGAIREVDLKRILKGQFGLSAQQIRVTYLACQGYRNREIAAELKIVEGTVKNYLTQVFNALAVRNRTELSAELHQLLEEQTDIHRRGN